MTAYASESDRELTKILKVFRGLEPIEVEALNRFYMQGHDAARVAADLGIDISQFRQLKSRVRQSYLALARPNLIEAVSIHPGSFEQVESMCDSTHSTNIA